MGHAAYVGRIGALAVALGVGWAIASTAGVAWAEPGSSPSSSDSAEPGAKNPGDREPSSGAGTSRGGGTSSGAGTGSAPAGDGDDRGRGAGDAGSAPRDAGVSSKPPARAKTGTTPVGGSGGANASGSAAGGGAAGPGTADPGDVASEGEAAAAQPPAADVPAAPTVQPEPELPVASQPAAAVPTARAGDGERAARREGGATGHLRGLVGGTSAAKRDAVPAGAAGDTGGTAVNADEVLAPVPQSWPGSAHGTGAGWVPQDVPSMVGAPGETGSAFTERVVVSSEVVVAPPNVVSKVLGFLGSSPLLDSTPTGPVDSPLLWAMLAACRQSCGRSGIHANATGAGAGVQTGLVVDDAAEPLAAPMAMAAVAEATNTAPTASPSYGSPNQVTGAMSGSVNGSDVDPNTRLTYTVTAAPAGGRVVVNGATGAFDYTPTEAARLAAGKTASADFDNFTVSVSDGQAATAVTVSPAVLPAVVSNPASATVGNNPTGVAVSPTKTYVVNQGSNTVSVIDRANPNNPPVTINVTSSPTAIALGPLGSNRAYVAGNGGVSVINTTNNSVVRTLSTGAGQLNGVAVSANGQRVYATNTATNQVVVLNPTASSPVVTRIKVGGQPMGVAVSNVGNRLYVANSGSNSVSVINTSDNTVVGVPIAVGAQPIGVVVSADGSRLYVSNAVSNTVTALNPAATNPVVATIAVGTQPRGLGISPDGSVVYAANTDDTVSMINTKTGTAITVPSIGGAPGQHGLAVSPDGRQIYITDAADRAARVLTINRGNTAPTPSTPIVGTPDPSTSAVKVTLTFEDTDGDFASHSWAQPATGTVADGGAGVYLFTPNKAARDLAAGTPGPDNATFTITVTDVFGAATSVDVTVPVLPNPAPVAPAPSDYVVTPVTAGTGPSGVAVTDRFTYVINYDSNNVTVINTATNQFVQDIAVGRGPLSVAASEQSKRVYVSSSLDNTVSVIDATPNTATTNKVVGTILIAIPQGCLCDSTEAGPFVYDNKVTELAVNREGTRLYVNATDGSLRVIDITNPNNTVISTTYPGKFNDLKVSPDGTRLYGTPGVGLTVIDTATMTAVGVQAGPVWDHSAMQSAYTDSTGNIAVSPDGKRVYVTYSATTVATGTGGHTSGSFITDAQGITWKITGGSGGVSVIDTDPASANYNKEIARVIVPNWAQDLVVSDGRLYVTDWDDMSVTVIDTTTNAIVGAFATDQTRSAGRSLWVSGYWEWWGYPDSGYISVAAFNRYITAGPGGKVYVTDYGNGTVYVIKPGSQTV